MSQPQKAATPDVSPTPRPNLEAWQGQAVTRLVDLVTSLPTRLATYPDDRETLYATFGLFGSRGVGKSTVLEKALRRLAEEATDFAVCLEPLDCTCIAPDLPFGLSVVEHVQRHLVDSGNGREGPGEGYRSEEPSGRPETPLEQARAKVLRHFIRTDPQYRNLELALAVTPLEFDAIAEEEVNRRGSLGRAISGWVDALLGKLHPKKRVLLALEDFDLALRSLDLALLNSFLDELKDPRLAFLIVADEEHLDERAAADFAGGRSTVAPATLRKLLHKLIPVVHRVHLEPWTLEHVREQRPEIWGHARKLVERLPAGSGLLLRHLEPLVPRLPRGFCDLDQELASLAALADAVSEESPAPSVTDLVAVFARCRGDHQLARELASRPLEWWSGHLRWRPKRAQEVSWQRSVAEAKGGQPLRMLGALELPLAPRKGSDRLLWAELLVNAAGSVPATGFLQLIGEIPPLKQRLDACVFSYRPALAETLAWLRAPSPPRDTPWFEWHGEHAAEAEISAGFLPLVLHAAGRSRSTLARLLGDTAIPWSDYPSATIRHSADRGLLPRDFRSLIVLLDRLADQPWAEAAFWTEEADTESWPAAVALICARGYLAALGGLPEEEIGGLPQSARLEMEASLAFAGLDSGELLPRVRALAGLASQLARKKKAKKEEGREPHPLLSAAGVFFASQAFRQAARNAGAATTR